MAILLKQHTIYPIRHKQKLSQNPATATFKLEIRNTKDRECTSQSNWGRSSLSLLIVLNINFILVHFGSKELQTYYLLFHQSSLIPLQEACLSSPLRVAFQYWGFLSKEKKNVSKSTRVSLQWSSLKVYLLRISPSLFRTWIIMSSSTN